MRVRLGTGLLMLGMGLTSPPAHADRSAEVDPVPTLRVATFNAALSGETADDLAERLATGEDPQLRRVAAIIQHVRPDVLLLNEFDHRPDEPPHDQTLARQFQDNYLARPQFGQKPIRYPTAYSPRVNTGQPTGLDLDGDGTADGPGDAHGWGKFPGQYGMLVLTQFGTDGVLGRDERRYLWDDLPFSFYPEDFYPAAAQRVLRLSSKTHKLLPMEVAGREFALLISHPTPPVFDGPEDRNGKRNFDQTEGPLIVMGDLNADPNDGESLPGAMDQLLTNDRLQDPRPRSDGGAEAAGRDGGINAGHRTDPALDTADWNDDPERGPGNLRVDYVLPSVEWQVRGAGVFWPAEGEPGQEWVGASDHRLVWVDLALDRPPTANPRRAPFGR